MGNRWLVGLAVVVAVVAVGGVGFAAFTTTAYLQGSAQAGQLGPLTWSNLGNPVGNHSYNKCSISTTNYTSGGSTQDTLVLTAKNQAPGDWCQFKAHLNNLGTIPAEVYANLTCYSGGMCGNTSLYDNFAGWYQPGETYGHVYGPLLIKAGSYLKYDAEILLGGPGLPPVGNSYENGLCSFTVTFWATAGT